MEEQPEEPKIKRISLRAEILRIRHITTDGKRLDALKALALRLKDKIINKK